MSSAAGPAEGGGAADAEGGKRKREADPKELAGDQLSTLLEQIGDFTPTIPPAVIEYYLTKSGVATKDDRIIKLVALAAQKFVSDVAVDAMNHCRQRQAGSQAAKKGAGKDKRHVLCNVDLQAALKEHGVTTNKPPYYI